MGEDGGVLPHERTVRAVLARRGHPPGALRLLGAGLDHAAFLVDEHVVIRVTAATGAEGQVIREAHLLRRLAAALPLPIPRPLWSDPAAGCLAYRLLPGRPLLHALRTTSRISPATVGTQIGRLLSVLHSLPPEAWSDAVPAEPPGLDAWVSEAGRTYADVVEHVPTAHRAAVEEFLGTAPPQPAARTVLCHNDLGIEHVLVLRGMVSGILDWSDCALTDPARDLALLYRDLGPDALEAALRVYEPHHPDDRLVVRARFLARCGLLEDLAHGLRTGQHAYSRKSIEGLGWVFSL